MIGRWQLIIIAWLSNEPWDTMLASLIPRQGCLTTALRQRPLEKQLVSTVVALILAGILWITILGLGTVECTALRSIIALGIRITSCPWEFS